QMMMQMEKKALLYLNFESPHLYDFSLSDFSRLDNIIMRKGVNTLFFDELQLVEGWEMFVRQKLDQDYQIIITGSNASLLSKELGTKLTGRHITQELFPFSYSEFLSFKDLKPSPESLSTFMNTGGFPEYLKTGDEEQLATLFDDVLVRDIVVRYGIRDIKSLQRLAIFLVSNIGNRVTATKLKQPLSIAATSTVLTWFSYLELSYLISFLPMFSHSTKAQLINPRKVYAIDLGLVHTVSNTTTEDLGRKLENLIFLHLRRKYKELYYFDENGECDFVAMERGKVKELVQVCYIITPDNIDRELKGLRQAMRFFNFHNAIIVTFDTRDVIKEDGFEIEIIPACNYLIN
ncbi:MAG: ATP-binding protein, partial [Cyclobacteriaceae bacterium]|nr:ATP-binding protein [Cyclobacteriaceae bacterium]